MQRNYHKKTVNQRLEEQATTLAAKLYAAEERIKTLSAANTKLVQEKERLRRQYDWAQETSIGFERKWHRTSRFAAASVALNIVLIVALAVVIVRCV